MFNTPILFLIFKRPDTTQKVFAEIKKIKPKYLYVAADGPHEGDIEEKKKCLQTRDIVSQVDWECEVKLLYREQNLGCKTAVSQAITWFFDHVSEGIILEDDCLPNLSFFRFCEEMLTYYRNDTRIMQICGYNLVAHDVPVLTSYYYSHLGYMWGWACWARAWKYYDVNMPLWPKIKDSYITHTYPFTPHRNQIYNDTYNGLINTWDFQWHFTTNIQSGLVIVPSVNLVRNIGFGSEGATFCNDANVVEAFQEDSIMEYPLIHPDFVFPNLIYERRLIKINQPCLKILLKTRIQRMMRHVKKNLLNIHIR